MKKITILLIMISVAFNYSCNKDGKKVETTISGQLRTNGTEDVIKINPELSLPTVDIYRAYYSGGDALGGGSKYEILTTVPISSDGKYSLTLDLNTDDEYFVGYSNIDESIYYSREYTYWSYDKNARNHISIGDYNNIVIYVNAKSWVIPRFINTNTDPDNVDVFDTKNDNIGPNQYSILLTSIDSVYEFLPLKGNVDTIAPWIHSTWSGTYKYGVHKPDFTHKVEGKLTRNGVTKDVSIIYNVPPFDTTVVEIRY